MHHFKDKVMIRLVVFIFLISTCIFSCGEIKVQEDYDLSYLYKLLTPSSIGLGIVYKYEDNLKKKFIGVSIEGCGSCFLPQNDPAIISSYVALILFGQGINNYDGVEVEVSRVNSEFKVLTGVGEFPIDDLKLVKSFSSNFISNEYSLNNVSSRQPCLQSNGETVNNTYQKWLSKIVSKFPTATLMGYSKIMVKGDKEKFKFALMYQLVSCGEEFGTLMTIYNKEEVLESFYYCDNYRVDFDYLVRLLVGLLAQSFLCSSLFSQTIELELRDRRTTACTMRRASTMGITMPVDLLGNTITVYRAGANTNRWVMGSS